MKREDQLLQKIVGFGKNWAAMLWRVMVLTGRGYKRESMGHTGKGNDRRKDKLEDARLGIPKAFRQYRDRYKGTVNP